MRVLSYDEAAERSSVVRRTLEREGPATVEVSKRRRGILDCDLDAWLLKRRRPAPGDEADEAAA
jgi:hypothetical protein